MTKKQISILVSMALLTVSQITWAADAAKTKKPLKVYVLSGQSNMQGQADLSTVPRMSLSPETKALHDKMVDEKGQPRVSKNVSIVYFTGGDEKDGEKREEKVSQGPLAAGVVGKIGPDIAYGITMGEATDDPILIIKAAWGGRDLRQNFRPPSAGPYEEDKDRFGNPTGHYYKRIVECVNQVLADPGKYHPAYDKDAGYEIAGFVWFQGFNDMIAGSRSMYKATQERPAFAAYTDLLACLIRDLRKDLKAPTMPCVIGVVGFDGVKPDDPFRKAQAAVAALPEFKGTVAAVETGGFWDNEMVAALEKVSKANDMLVNSKQWTVVGKPGLNERIWHYTSFEVDPEKQYSEKDKGFGASREFYDVTPAELKDWLNPAFDTSKWQKGPAPIIKGTVPVKSKGKKKKGQEEQKEEPKAIVGSPWGEGNMLLMKTTFTADPAEFSKVRLCFRSTSSFKVYLNGKLIHDYPWWKNDEIRKSELDASSLKQGVNELAFYGNIIEKENSPTYNIVDVYVEGLPKAAMEAIRKEQEAVASPRDYELAKGESNQGFHYLGSAYTYSRIGEAFAKAMIELQKNRD
jgi:hypothetical protein